MNFFIINKALSKALLLVALICLCPVAVAAETVELPHTDGFGLMPQLPPLEKNLQQKLYQQSRQSCDTGCATPFGQILGKADGAVGYSNCQSICVKPEYSFLNLTTGEISNHTKNPQQSNLHYIGVIYQCVEYARKWWMKNLNITFGSIDSAYQILYLSEGQNIRTNEFFPLARSINGSAKRAPKRGDLIIYAPDRSRANWRHGHVAVVVAVELKAGTLSVAEENYDNKPWQDPEHYSRKISIFKTGNYYTVLDLSPGQKIHSKGAAISGWIYPYKLKDTNP